MIETVTILVLHTVALHFTFVKISAYWPMDRRVYVGHLSQETRRRQALLADRLHFVLALMTLPVVIYGWHSFGSLFEQYIWDNQGPARFASYPLPFFRWVSAVCAGMAITGPLALGELKLILRKRYAEYLSSEATHFGADARNLLYVCLVWVIPWCVEWDIHCIDCYTRFEDRAVVINGFWSFGEQRLPYSQVSGIYKAKNFRPSIPGAIFPNAEYAIIFEDGTWWTSAEVGRQPRKQDKELIDFVAQKSGKNVTLVDSL